MAGRIILNLSAAVLLLAGAGGLFGAHELAVLLGAPDSAPAAAIVQTAASGMLGLGLLNWFSRNRPIGGIYGRPLGLANLVLFAIPALSINKALAVHKLPPPWTPVAVVMSALALAFAWLVFAHTPAGEPPSDKLNA